MARHDPDVLSALLDRALSLPPGARSAFLDDECRTDQPLREELDSLLVAHDASPGYFERLREQIISPALLALSRDSDDPLLGQTVAQYQIVEKLDVGGMAVVFKAFDVRLERFVALKFLAAPFSAEPEAKARLMAEARATSALDHPNIGIVHDIGETAGRLFIVMAYYEGETLERMTQTARLSVQHTLELITQIAKALAAAHRKGLVHRDVKPSNILVTREGTAKLLDFGIAKLMESNPASEDAVAGTVAYMSPEQTRGMIVDHRTDLWSLGVVLYELLTELRPFRADDAEATIRAIRHDTWTPVECLNPGVPAGVSRILAGRLAKDPVGRYGNAQELLNDLERENAPAPVPRHGPLAASLSTYCLTAPPRPFSW